MQRFDPDLPGFMQGDVTDVTLREPASFAPLGVSNLVIDPTRPFGIRVEWEVYGLLVPLWMSALGGAWNVSVYAESVGGGPERLIGTANVNVNNSSPATVHAGEPNARKYTANIQVAPNTLQEGNPGSNRSGVYKLVTTTFLDSSLPGVPGFDVVGFEEGPIIMVENPV
ncbi:MAG: hypothetical protein OEW30_11975 [Acidimicrobiia bacterium]|nr:hypothetical protein [Acidimicrobiia bacterium]